LVAMSQPNERPLVGRKFLFHQELDEM